VLGPLILSSVLVAPLPPVQQAPAAPPSEMVIRLTVDPMPAPKPALRYLLLPDLKEMTPGNPIPTYLSSMLDQDFTLEQEALPPSALRQADRAARMDKPDWQLLPRLKTDGIGLLLPDLQKMRSLAAGLQSRFRDEIASRRYDDALGTARTMFALSKHTGEHPTVIGNLVGFAIAMITIAPLEEMLEQPGCPNLYWALTSLPDPLISLRTGVEGERILILAELRGLDDKEPMTPAQLTKLMDYLEKLREFGVTKKDPMIRRWVANRTKDPAVVQAARARLVEGGLAEKRVARFPADQVILLDEKLKYEILRDEEMKLMALRTWEVEAHAFKITSSVKEESLFWFFLPSLQRVRRAQGRLEQRIALLRHVEALRMYAADHAGELPEKLADVKVPLPVDPFTGKPFRYTREGSKAHLRGSPPRGEDKNPTFNLHYEITIRK
jgi:hypothetical protein